MTLDEPAVDVAFALEGRCLARDHEFLISKMR